MPQIKSRFPVVGRFPIAFVILGLVLLSACSRHQLRVEPKDATVRLDQSVAFSAVETGKGSPKNAHSPTWKARNLTEHQPAIISPDGTFTASLPGKYKITAISGRLKGHTIARVPKGVTRNPNEKPWTTTTVSSRSVNGVMPPPLPQPPLTGPGWRDDNLLSAFLIQNRRGRDPLRPHPKTRSLNVDGGTGNGNYLLGIPLLGLPGRGLNLSLELFYNSELWYSGSSSGQMFFDHDHGWPAPGWSLGFGRVVQYGSYVGVVEDADGTLHPFSGPVGSYGDFTQANIQTNDGTLIDGTFFYENSRWWGGLSGGWIKYPNGTTVTYGAPGQYEMYPIEIRDANGNFITITYVNNVGPQIETIQDTLGRVINFNYDQNNLLTSIATLGLNGSTRVVARFHYSPLVVSYAFKEQGRGATGVVWNCTKVVKAECTQAGQAIDAIYFPGTSTGYWFGDSDSYSSYGMIAKVSQRRGMILQPPSTPLDEQGSLTRGIMTEEKAYNYPLGPDNTLTGPPVYTTMTESWAGTDSGGTPITITAASDSSAGTATITLSSPVTSPSGAYFTISGMNSPYAGYNGTWATTAASTNSTTITLGSLASSLAACGTQSDCGGTALLTKPAVTTYSVQMNETPPNPNEVDTVYPDGTRVTQLLINDPGQYDDGLLSEQTTSDALGNVLRTVTRYWEPGDYNSPRLNTVVEDNQHGLKTRTAYNYGTTTNSGNPTNPNQVTSFIVSHYDSVDGNPQWVTDRQILTDYISDGNYTDFRNRHIFDLAKCVKILDQQGNVASQTEYAYDQSALAETPGIVGHSQSYDPNAPPIQTPAHTVEQCSETCTPKGNCSEPQCTDVTQPGTTIPVYDPLTKYRGNVTQITRYVNSNSINETSKAAAAITSPLEQTVETRLYDIAGNLVMDKGSCCVQTSFTYSVDTDYAYPEQIIRGDSTAHGDFRGPFLSQSFVYDFDTGVTLTSTDPNYLTTILNYDDALRVKNIQLPTAASLNYEYDDAKMSTTQTTLEATGTVAKQSVTRFNGLGLPQQVLSLAAGNTWNAVSTKYDVLGRVAQQSNPYSLAQGPTFWTTLTYDFLGRVTAGQNPSGKVLRCYDESVRPNAASSAPGQTVRSVSNIPSSASITCEQTQTGTITGLRERWSRTNMLGELVEVVEPAAAGNGSLFDPQNEANNVDTSYAYNGLGLLTRVLQGPAQQERDFQYDLLGRLTAESLPEKSPTLDDNGKYVGLGGLWSDFFTYDTQSNLTSHTDARGVQTIYMYKTGKCPADDGVGDPLNRLQQLCYQSPSSSNIPSSFSASYQYDPNFVTRLATMTLRNGDSQPWGFQYGYDGFGRLASTTAFYPGQSPLVLSYKYDSLNRLKQKTYPAEYGTPNQPQKMLDYQYGVGSTLADLKVDGVDYASQFAYNSAGQVTFIAVGASGVQQTLETYNYDPATSLLCSQEVQTSASEALLSLAYQYFPNGQLSQQSEGAQTRNCQLSGVAEERVSYDYDALGRLLDAKASGSDTHTWSETYALDTYGNRISVTASGKAPDGSPVPLDGLAGIPTPPNGLSALEYDQNTNHVKASACQLKGTTTPCFIYDSAGNQTQAVRSDGSLVNYQYDQANRLFQVTETGNNLVEQYTYAPDGRRLKKDATDGATFYLWDGPQVIAEYTQSNADKNWGWSRGDVYLGSRILASFTPTNSGELVNYYHPDRLGIRLITTNVDSSATEQVTLPFGTSLQNGSQDPENPIFTTYDRDFATGLDYAQNRFYDSKQRFTQVDPVGIAAVNLANPQSINLYAYVANDPINATDSSGLVPCRGNATTECGLATGADPWEQSDPLGPDAVVEVIGLGFSGSQMATTTNEVDLSTAEVDPNSVQEASDVNTDNSAPEDTTEPVNSTTGYTNECLQCGLLVDENHNPLQLQCEMCSGELILTPTDLPPGYAPALAEIQYDASEFYFTSFPSAGSNNITVYPYGPFSFSGSFDVGSGGFSLQYGPLNIFGPPSPPSGWIINTLQVIQGMISGH